MTHTETRDGGGLLLHAPRFIMTEAVEWTKTNTLHLIDILKEHPCIWQVKNKHYKDKNKRKSSMESITTELSNLLHCIVTPDNVAKKIHTLRSQFQREIKKKSYKKMHKSPEQEQKFCTRQICG